MAESDRPKPIRKDPRANGDSLLAWLRRLDVKTLEGLKNGRLVVVDDWSGLIEKRDVK